MVLLVVALLASVTDLLPSVAAQQVGRGGWLIGFGALPVLLLVLWICSKVFCGDGIFKTLGKQEGYTITIIYLMWIVFVLAAVQRLGAARMEDIYGKAPSVWLSVAVIVAAAWIGMGKSAALARTAEIFYLALAVVLAGVLLLALFKVEKRNLYPVEWTRAVGGSVRSAGILLNVVPVAVLGMRIPKKEQGVKKSAGWAVIFCVAIALVVATVLGCVGSGLSARLEAPYLIMVQGLGIKGAFQRTEALVASTWLLSDLIMCASLFRAGSDYVAQITPKGRERWSVMSLATASLVVGWLLFPGEEVRTFCIRILPMTGIVFGAVFPMFLWVISCVRARKRR